jgi:hypothetical protein
MVRAGLWVPRKQRAARIPTTVPASVYW